MDAGIPLPGVLHLAQVGTVETDAAHGRVLDAHLVLDREVTQPRGTQGEDPLDDGRHLVWLELAVHHVVASRRVVLPASTFGGLALAHLGVLNDLVAVVLGEDPRDPDLHLARRRGQVEVPFVDRMHRDAVLLEEFDEPGEVTLVAAEAIPAPDEQMLNLVRLDQREQFVHRGPVQVLARPTLVFEHRHWPEVAQTREVAAALRLSVGGELDLVLS